jgi:predicted HTH transcriptional regulator
MPQDSKLHMVKRERWTEDDLDALASEEPDIFERKSGKLMEDKDKFRDSAAKALSAFANSGGGSLVVGVGDDGTSDGVDPLVGRASVRDWIEQVTPRLLDFPLSDFRVHAVIRRADGSSRIPHGKEVVVIDVGDSPLAPHQSARDYVYYHRQGGRSVPARHFYLELLRQRLS